jgi:glyoxylase I family protein
MEQMIKQVAHVNIVANDLPACEAFYCGILGMEKAFEFLKEGELLGFYLKAGSNTFIEVFAADQAPATDRLPIKHLCLEVDDLDEVIEAVRAKGWAITDKELGCDHAWQSWITDPTGVQIELHQYTPQSSHFTGKPCIVDW